VTPVESNMTRTFMDPMAPGGRTDLVSGWKPPLRCYVGKVGISAVTMAQTLELLDGCTRHGRAAYVCVTNVHATVLAQRDREFCRIQNGSFLSVPDGMPLIWYARMMGERRIERVCGPDLMIELLRSSPQHGYTHYFYGDTAETLAKMKWMIEMRFPGTKILAMHSPPFRAPTDTEVRDTIGEINRLRPSFVWVGLGCPKQELWIGRVFPHIESSVLLGVGAAFRFLAGEYSHPPRILQVCGLEGICWRALRRPGYVVRWYAYHTPMFGCLFLKGVVRRFIGGWGRGGLPRPQP
jgi:N-acetylglucosaminyldiphosphoundecaprenol N-acetyl-beta-D-mannosaminyltransferase